MSKLQQTCLDEIEMLSKNSENNETITSLTMAISEQNPPPPSYRSIDQPDFVYNVATTPPARLV